jgi:heme-degrading monooxygenase HmoA
MIEIIRYNVAAGQEAAFEEAYAKAGEYLSGSPHSLGYQVTRCVEEPNRYVVLIEWDSLDGHLQGFRRSPAFRPFFALVRPYFEAIEEMQHYEEVSTFSRAGVAGR